MTKHQIWCCSCCRRKPLEQTTWLETWYPWSWYTGHQEQSWKRKKRECAEWPLCPMTASQVMGTALASLPWHPKIRHFDHVGFPHQAVPGSLQEKKVQRQKVRAEKLSQPLVFILAEQIVLKKRRIKVTSKRAETWGFQAFYTFYGQHVPVAKKAFNHQPYL